MEIIKYSNKNKAVYKYKNNSGEFWGYRLKYEDQDGKRREKKKSGFKKEKDAIEHIIETQNNIIKKNYAAVNPSKITVGEFFNQVMEENKPNDNGIGYWSAGTYSGYVTFKKRYIDPTIGHIKLSDLTAEMYRKTFINKLDSLSPSTIRLQHVRMNQFINEAVARDIIPKNKIRNVKIPQSTRPQESEFLTVDELETFLNRMDQSDKIKEIYKVLFNVLAYSGIRIGEARALNWNDVNFNDNTITINKAIDNSNRMGLTKARNYRIVEVDDSIIAMLKVYKKKKINMSQFKDNSDYIFKTPTAKMPINYDSIRVQSIKLGKLFINKSISPHIFRHTHASILLMTGQPTRLVAHRLGNTEQTIMKYYSHVIPGIATSAVDAFNSKFGAKSGAKSKVTQI